MLLVDSKMADKQFLRYRIHAISSEALPGQAHKLLSLHEDEGWVSAPMPTYPQFITIQFFLPVRTLNMGLLLHQYKIPSLIEIFVKEKAKEPYQRLGCFRPSDNEQTGWEQRELKTVYFEYPCSFIKIVLHEPYSNKYNLLKQVAIEEITVKGALLDPELGWLSANTLTMDGDSDGEEEQKQEVSRNPPLTLERASSVQGTISFPEVKTIFEILQKRKEEAVEEEDFELASHLKSQILGIKQMESKLFQLQTNKKKAIQNEDYDKAAFLKKELVKLKQNLQHELGRLTSTTPNTSFSLQSPEPKYFDRDSSIMHSANNNTYISEHESQVVAALANKIYQSNQTDRRINSEGESQLIRETRVEATVLEELDSRTQMEIEKYKYLIPIEFWISILGKNCRAKQEVLRKLEELSLDTMEEILACLLLCSYAIRDKHPIVLDHTLQLLSRVVNCDQSRYLTSMPFSLVDILPLLPILLIDNNSNVKQLAQRCILDLPEIACVNLSHILPLIIPKKAKAVKEIPKLTQAKLVVTHLLLDRYKLSNEQMTEVLEWTVALLEDPNQEVRATASQFILEALIPLLGADTIKNKVKNIRPNALNNFLAMLNQSVRNMGEDQTESRVESSKSLNTTPDQNIPLSRHLPTKQPFQSKSESNSQLPPPKIEEIRVFQYQSQEQGDQGEAGEDGEEGEEGEEGSELCDYCKCALEGPDYDKSLEQHLAVCKMMVTCEECSYIVQIRKLCDHLLHECESAKYHQCDNCGLAFPFTQLHSHKARGSCKPRKKGFERCQNCAKDVPPNDDAWIAHAYFCR